MQKYSVETKIRVSEYKKYDDDPLLSLTKLINDKHKYLKRGDVIRDCSNMCHNKRYVWDGENVIEMMISHESYESIPLVFSCPEFSPTYFSVVLDYHSYCNIDSSLREQIKSNMIYGIFPKKSYTAVYFNPENKKPHPKPYPRHIAYSWFNQDIKWLDSDRYNEFKTAIAVSHAPDVLADMIMQFMGKTCWVRGKTYISYEYDYNHKNMQRCQCKRIVTGKDIPLLIDPPLDTCGNIDPITHCLNPETHTVAMEKEFLSERLYMFLNDDIIDYDIITID